MLSVSSIRSKEYYVDLSSEDYYLKGGEPPGKWYGKGAAFLVLQGRINPDHFRNAIDGFSADGARKLVQNAGSEQRQPGWDLTFSAPKTVSVVWSQADETTCHQIQKAQEEAVRKALDWLEDESITRRGKGGYIKEKARLIIATFEHGTSRAHDPQLHTHALIMNAAVRGDGSTGAIESQQFYQNKMTAGALYRAELAKQLEQRLGLQSERRGDNNNLFELRGVDPALVDEFSKRREEIEKALNASGNSSARASEIAALDTRHVKGHIAREELFMQWRAVGVAYGYQQPQPKTVVRNEEAVQRALYELALEEVLFRESSFTKTMLLRKFAEQAPGTGIGAEDIRQFIEQTLKIDENIVCLGRVDNKIRYTTVDVLQMETAMLKKVTASADSNRHLVDDRLLTSLWKQYPTLRQEQKAAIEHLTGEPGAIKVAEGWAGTGKTYMLNIAREAWQRAGYQVHGAALSAKAGSELEKGAGIQSQTLHSLLYRLQNGKLELGRRDIVVVDEAAMVGNRQMAALVDIVDGAGAKLILVGDHNQLQAIESGGAFKKIGQVLGRTQLTEITRQTVEWMRIAVRQMIEGHAKEVLADYARHGQLNVQANKQQAREALIRCWCEEGGTVSLTDNIILAGSNLDVYDLNQRAQKARYDAGLLGEGSLKLKAQQIYEQDLVLFTKNNKRIGVKNGQQAFVEKIDGSVMRIRLEDGATLAIDTRDYDDIKLGYAITTHKAQGATRQQGFVLLGGAMQDRELSYVQLSRTKGKTLLFADREEAGDELFRLTRQMERSRQKEMAIEHFQRGQGLISATREQAR